MDRKTPLYDMHLGCGANMVPFANWLMPLHYGSQLQEHNLVREKAGVFDVSHMGIIDIYGKEAKSFLKRIMANDPEKIHLSQRALYTCMLNEAGGVLDDLIVYHVHSDYYRLVVNAATTQQDLAWLQANKNQLDLKILLQTDLAMLAVQGPTAISQALETHPLVAAIPDLKLFQSKGNEETLVARTGYTGEAGFEIILPQTEVRSLWQALLEKDIAPIGLGARDSLRLEAGLNLYGSDMDAHVTPFESNLGWTVDFRDQEREFIGKAALEMQKSNGVPSRLEGYLLGAQGKLLRRGMSYNADEEIGVFTSGGYSPTLKQSIGFGRIANKLYSTYRIEIRGTEYPLEVQKMPFVKQR